MDELTSNLLALHYVQPLTANRLSPILQLDRTLQNLSYMTPSQIALLLKMNTLKASSLLNNFKKIQHTDWQQYYAEKNITPIPFYDERYPKSLLDVFDPPAVIYCRGKIPILQKKKKIAIVGSRESTNYSQKCLDEILPTLISHDIVIVSGLAKGADQMAHETTIRLSGQTIAVLGCGLDHIYPREHEVLQSYMEKHQLIISEYPPYMTPKKWHFPMRNRIISGLSAAVLVTEAAIKSGTLSTVDYALNHGRNIFSIPGSIFSPLSKGSHKLILEGATPVWEGHQIIEETEGFSNQL
ncbi:DNA-processing protein DprA [Kurthia zopfii]|uniref:DNA-processing protein DprA n=1 Tax=Kurthia zopfii TaxID=1650 RepID=UPI000F7006EC|nr:DNA-processing protein DprA [Kurthia zopfii]VEI04718.1 DNA protecting protein DprA [Kurthia zopfii]